MRRSLLASAFLAVGVLACLASTASAADLDKYLPDDAQMVAVVNVKQITSWTPFQKQIQDQLQQAMKMGQMSEMPKDTGVDPFRDIDRVIVVTAADSYKTIRPPQFAPPPLPIKPAPGGNPPAPPAGFAAPPPPPPPPGVGPPPGTITMMSSIPIGFSTFVLIQGKFDADKLEAKARQAAKDHPTMVKSRMVGGTELWDIATELWDSAPGAGGDHIYLAMLDKGTLMATGLESQALEAVDKANGKKKTAVKDKQVRDAVAKMDPKAALQVAACGDLVTSVSMNSDGKGGFKTTTRSNHDDGIEGFHATVTLGDADMHGEFTMTAKDADRAKELAKSANDGLEMGLKNITAAAQQMKDLLPLVDAMKTVKITASGDTISAEGSATPDAVAAGVKAMFMLAPAQTKPPEKPIPVDAPPPPKKDK